MENSEKLSTNSMEISMNGPNGSSQQLKLVKAIYAFKGSNNDELCFSKDDIITLTQCPSGGWWEGTLQGITGWFPSNYCQPLHEELINSADNVVNNTINDNNTNSDSDTQQYRNMVFQDIVDTESAYVKELSETLNKYLKPLQQSQILAENEINSIIRIIQDIGSVHRKFLSTLESLNSVAYKDSRIGGVFLEFAPQIKCVHFEYCANHSKFVHLIEKFKKEICNLFGNCTTNASEVSSLGSNVHLTTCLSSSFRRIDKYPALLQELQRYTDESHVDRGDTQRAGFVFRELSMSCLELRRQKEMELEVMLGNIKNWDGMNIQSFGEIIRMDCVSIQIVPDYSEMKKDRYLVLFPQILLVLSVSNEMTSFLYEAKILLENACIKIADELLDKTNIFEITFSEANNTTSSCSSCIIQCPTIEDTKNWIQLLQKYIQNSKNTTNRSAIPSVSNSSDCSSNSNIILNTTTPPQRNIPSTATRSRYWSTRSLIPHPPTRVIPNTNTQSKDNNNNKQQITNNEDMLILQVIESYCAKNTGRMRQSSKNSENNNPQVFIVDEEKLQQSEATNSLGEDISSIETSSLREEIKLIKLQLSSLSNALNAERKSRKKLKAFIMEKKSAKKHTIR